MAYNPSGPSYNPGGPAYNPGGSTAPVAPPSIQEVINTWIASVTRPAIQTYAAEVPRASQNNLIISVGIVTVLAAIFGLISGMEHNAALPGFIFSLIATPVGFLIGVAAYYLGARVMSGTGTFLQHAWVWSTIWAPITIVTSLLGIIPVLGGLVGLVVGLYSLYLYYLSIQAVHNISGTNAILAIVIGVVIAIVGGIIVGIILGIVGLGAAAATGVLGR